MSIEARKLEILKAAQAEGERWGNRRIVWDMDLATTLVVTGALQLALRHPELGGSRSGQTVREQVMALVEGMPAEFPALRELLCAGFDSSYDE
jgi:hypothetical protein